MQEADKSWVFREIILGQMIPQKQRKMKLKSVDDKELCFKAQK